jgi:hypothetical protein
MELDKPAFVPTKLESEREVEMLMSAKCWMSVKR